MSEHDPVTNRCGSCGDQCMNRICARCYNLENGDDKALRIAKKNIAKDAGLMKKLAEK